MVAILDFKMDNLSYRNLHGIIRMPDHENPYLDIKIKFLTNISKEILTEIEIPSNKFLLPWKQCILVSVHENIFRETHFSKRRYYRGD